LQPNKLLLALPVIAVLVAASGCTIPGLGGGGATGIGNGIVIQDFSPDFASVQSGDDVQVQVKVQNLGEVKAFNTVAELTGIDVSAWGGGFGAYSSSAAANLGDLLPFDKEKNTPGAVRTNIWQLKAPSQSKGINTPYIPIVKVSYDYKTSAQKLITIVDENELRRILQVGTGTLPSETSTASAGPLSVEITTGAYEKSTAQQFGFGDNLFPVQIKITNTGGGVVVPPGTGTSFYGGGFSTSYFGTIQNYPVGIKITPPEGTSFAFGSGFNSVDDCSTGTVTKDMWKGKELIITCELTINSPPTYKESRPILVDAFYRYQSEASTSIQVFGTSSDSGYGGISGYGW